MKIKASAAKAISDWQAFFASKSMERAMEIAQAVGTDQISRAHLDTAALETIEKLKLEIQPKAANNDNRRAAWYKYRIFYL